MTTQLAVAHLDTSAQTAESHRNPAPNPSDQVNLKTIGMPKWLVGMVDDTEDGSPVEKQLIAVGVLHKATCDPEEDLTCPWKPLATQVAERRFQSFEHMCSKLGDTEITAIEGTMAACQVLIQRYKNDQRDLPPNCLDEVSSQRLKLEIARTENMVRVCADMMRAKKRWNMDIGTAEVIVQRMDPKRKGESAKRAKARITAAAKVLVLSRFSFLNELREQVTANPDLRPALCWVEQYAYTQLIDPKHIEQWNGYLQALVSGEMSSGELALKIPQHLRDSIPGCRQAAESYKDRNSRTATGGRFSGTSTNGTRLFGRY